MNRLLLIKEHGILIIVIAVTVILSAIFQERLTVAGGFGWDGNEYRIIANQCYEHKTIAAISAMAPFCFRVLTPCLVGFIWGGANLTGFLLLNVTAGIVSAFLFHKFISNFIKKPNIRLITTIAYIVMWTGPIRIPFWAPAESVDPLFMVLFLLALNIMLLENYKHKFVLLTGLIYLGVFVRETMLLVPVALLMTAIIEKKYTDIMCSSWVLFVGLAGFIFLRIIIKPTQSFGFAGTALHFAYHKSILHWLHAMFIVFGPALALIIFKWKDTFAFFNKQKALGILGGFIFILAWIGGTDTERFFIWSSPIVLLAAGLVLENIRPTKYSVFALSLVAIGYMVTQRVFLTVPDFNEDAPRAWPILTPILAKHSTYLVSNNEDIKVIALSLLQHLVLTGTIVFLLIKPNLKRRRDYEILCGS